MLTKPADGALEPLLTPAQRDYVLLPREIREQWFADNPAKKAEMRAAGNRPRPVRLEWCGTDERPVKVEIRRKKDGVVAFSWRGVTNALDVLNLEIAREYEWRVTCGQESASRTFRTEDLAPRFVRVENVANMRDLGGRIGLGSRRVRQGQIYRSAGWNSNARWTYLKDSRGKQTKQVDANVPPVLGTNYVTAAGRAYACGTLGIRSDIDLRTDRECHGMSGSPLGETVSWFHHSYLGYYETATPAGRRAFADVFRVLLNEKNYPVVFHCIGGADRTGTLAFILNALLGCDEDELFLDWEVTGFTGGVTDSRHRNWFHGLVRTIGRQKGESWADKAASYVRLCGFTDADIEKFREMMLEPEPAVSDRPAPKRVSASEAIGLEGGRRLNNFVVELADVPLKDGTVSFTMPRTGWICVALHGAADAAKVSLDKNPDDVCPRRTDGRRESMRYISLGRHSLRVSGVGRRGVKGARLTVRHVKMLYHGGLQFAPDGENPAAGPFTREFHHLFVENAFNTFGIGLHPSPEESAETNRLSRYGAMFTRTVKFPPRSPAHEDLPAMRALYETTFEHAGGCALVLDEVGLGAPERYNQNLGRVMQDFRRANPCAWMHTCLCDVINDKIRTPDAIRDIVEATVSSGERSGMLISEHYLLAPATWERARHGIACAAAYAESLRQIDPFAPAHNIYYIGAYLRPGDWTPYASPAADMKVLVAKFLYALATDSRFRDIGGTGVSRFWCDEEFARWACSLVRYYAIDGGTEDIAERLGWRYAPGHLRNGDFLDGFDGWRVGAAAAGTLVATNRPGSGKQVFGRIGAGRGGDAFALFTRSAARPNTLSQTISGLVPGKIYSLSYVTSDLDEILKPGIHSTNVVMTVRISNAHQRTMGSYRSFWPPVQWAAKRRPTKAAVCAHKIVFEAQSPEAEVIFSDWADEATPGGRIGERRILNNVGVCPYFSESEVLK